MSSEFGLEVHSTHDVLRLVSLALLFLLKVMIAASVDTTIFCKRLDRKVGMAVGILCQFIILPFCGFAIARILQMEPRYGMALMVIMTSPGGSYSNWLCALFNSDLAMSVAMTGASTLVGVIMLPVNLYMYGTLLYGEGQMNHERFTVILESLAVIFAALVIGLTISHILQSENARDGFAALANVVGVSLFVLSLFVSEHKSTTPVWRKPLSLHISIAGPIVAAIILSGLISSIPTLGLTKPERVAVVIEACYQNPGLASSIVIGMNSNETEAGDAISVPILYGTYEAILLVLFCLGAYYCNWTLVDPKEVGLLEALRGNYQSRALEAMNSATHTPIPADTESEGPSQLELVPAGRNAAQ